MSILRAENLKIVVDDEIVIDDLSFEIEEKGIYAILGKSNLERTTLAKALAGIVNLEDGAIFYKDTYFDEKKSSRAIKAKIGYIPSKSFLYPDMTVFETLDFTGRMRKVDPDKRVRQIKEALDLLILSDKAEVLVKSLTESERKRLLFANALIGNPSVIIIDEPTANLPPDDVELLRDVISMLGERKTVIIFTEKLMLANEIAKHVGVMSKGKMALWSSLDNIKTKLNNDPKALIKTFMAFTDDGDGGNK